MIYWEILANTGLPSAGRGNKAAPLLTGPGRTTKSSARDLYPRGQNYNPLGTTASFPRQQKPSLIRRKAKPILAQLRAQEHHRIPARILT